MAKGSKKEEDVSLTKGSDPETPMEKGDEEEVKEAVEVQLDAGCCACASTRSKKALKASYLSCLGVMALFFIIAGGGLHAESEYEHHAVESMFLLAVLLYITITILSFFMNKPNGTLQWTAFGLFSGTCLCWFIAAITIFIANMSAFYTFCAMGLMGSIFNIAANILLLVHALRQEDVTLGLFSSLGMFVFVLANILFLGSFGTFITYANSGNLASYENAVGLILSGGVMFLFYFILEVLATFLPGIVMKIEIRNINADSSQ